MKISRRNEERINACLTEAKKMADLIHTSGYDPERNAEYVIANLKAIELCLYKPEGKFKESQKTHEDRMAHVLKSALESACARHMIETDSSVVRDAQEAINMLNTYANQARLKIN